MMVSPMFFWYDQCLQVKIAFATLAAVCTVCLRSAVTIKSKCKKIGATADAAVIIWLVGIKAIGPHGWDVRAVVITALEQRVR